MCGTAKRSVATPPAIPAFNATMPNPKNRLATNAATDPPMKAIARAAMMKIRTDVNVLMISSLS